MIYKIRFFILVDLLLFFEKSLLSDQKVLYEKRVVQMKDKMTKEYRERKIASARRLYNEEQGNFLKKFNIYFLFL